MATRYPELFENNTDFDLVIQRDWRLFEAARRLGARVTEPRYAPDVCGEDRQQRPGGHIIAKMCELAGIEGEVALRPYLHLTDTEVANGRLFARQLAIQSSNAGGLWPALTKQWYSERFQMVVEHLKRTFDFVQLGTSHDPPLAGALDLRDKTSPRQSAALLANSLVFVGLEGFLMHLARSVETRSVIVYGGRVLPTEIGYTANENLYSPLPCSPCWKYNSCEYDRECMKRVTVEEVVAAIRRQAAKAGEVLVVDKAVIA
jgi:hypothetical protein